eukprot:scaffold334_cov356-Prasinococcus_capsulatus_cf.AAC.4
MLGDSWPPAALIQLKCPCTVHTGVGCAPKPARLVATFENDRCLIQSSSLRQTEAFAKATVAPRDVSGGVLGSLGEQKGSLSPQLETREITVGLPRAGWGGAASHASKATPRLGVTGRAGARKKQPTGPPSGQGARR